MYRSDFNLPIFSSMRMGPLLLTLDSGHMGFSLLLQSFA
jgi:hypothetical protein